MRSPFKIDGPTCIAFSGGRTSAYMLHRVLEENGGLPAECVVSFQNTGKEHAATLEFVHAVETNWGVPIVWLEYASAEKRKYVVVDYETAAQNGEPYADLIRQRKYLPNPIARFCTAELKIRPCNRYLQDQGWDEWDQFIGIRADEQRRVVRVRNRPNPELKGVTNVVPLADAGIDVEQVGAFWDSQPFDLQIPTVDGVARLGNCDLCFLKGARQIQSIIAHEPHRADWWAEQESIASELTSNPNGALFRADRPSYSAMRDRAASQDDMFGADEEMLGCWCGD